MKNKYSLRYWLRTDKELKDGTCPIFLIISVAGQRSYFNTGSNLHPIFWDEEGKQARYVAKRRFKSNLYNAEGIQFLYQNEINDINLKLAALQKDVQDIISRFELDKKSFSSRIVADALNELRRPQSIKGKPKENFTDLITLIAENSKHTNKPNTIKTYIGLCNHIKSFEQAKKKKVIIADMGALFLTAFRDYLNFTASPKLNNTSAAKQIGILKRLVKKARKAPYYIEFSREIDEFNEYGNDTDNEVIALTEAELFKIRDIDLKDNNRLDQQRDVFLFASATGLRYSDLADLNRTHIKKDAIKKICVKTGKALDIPLNDLSRHVLNKYKTRLRPLPIISNDKTTEYIKEVAKICGIDEPIERVRHFGKKQVTTIQPKHERISIHTGRKTFITYMLSKGVPAQEVMKISGHKDWRSFDRYVNIAAEQVKNAMDKGFSGIMNKKNAG